MSIEIADAVKTSFDAEVKHDYQAAGGALRMAVRLKDVGGAKTHQFNKMGAGLASERGAIQTPIPLMNVSHTPVTVSVKNYTASELTDIFLNNQIPFDEKAELVSTLANAIRRREDQLIIDALVAATPLTTVANNVSGSTDDLTVKAIQAAAKALDGQNVPSEGRYLVTHASGVHNLLEDSQATSADFQNIKALVKGDIDTFYGFKIIKLGDYDEGGLPKDGSNDRTNFAFHKSAIGLAVNMDLKTMIDWDQLYGAHRCTSFYAGNAVAIDGNGIVKITCRES